MNIFENYINGNSWLYFSKNLYSRYIIQNEEKSIF